MRQRSSLALISLTVFIDLVGFGIVIPILPLYAQRFGASPLVIGCLLGVYSLMQAVCAPLLGRLSDRVGRRPVLIVSIAGSSAGFLLMGLADSLWLLFLARIIDGVTGGNIATAQAYLADITPANQRSKAMGIIGAAFGLGFIFGPAIGGVMSHVSPEAPFFFAAVLAACNALAVAWRLPESLPPERRGAAHEKPSLREVFRRARSEVTAASAGTAAARTPRPLPLILATYFCTTVAFSLLTATYPLYTNRRFGYDAAHNGYIFAGQGILGAIIQGLLLGRLLKLASERTLTMVGAGLLAVGLFTLPFGSSVSALLLATAVIAVGHGLVAAPLNGMASRSVGQSLQGRVLGLMQSAASLARIVGPVLGGALLHYDASGAAPFGRTPYWAAGAITLLACLLATAL